MDITRLNYRTEKAGIIQSIHKCSFIAVDTEFTGLHATQEDINSLFDSPAQRYEKLLRMARQYTTCQLGISTFIKMPNTNGYEAHTYNFYLFPRSLSSVDNRFTCQASSIEFLCKYQFDFNKLFYEGLSYLTRDQEEELRRQAETNPVLLASYLDEDLKREARKQVSEWMAQAQPDDELTVGQYEDLDGLLLQLVLQDSFPILRTQFDRENTGQITVRMMPDVIIDSQHVDQINLGNTVVDVLLGFTEVFRVLINVKKPIVGHNLLTDLMLLFEKFHNPLPERYGDFKRRFHQLFPHVYDTKHILFESKKNLTEAGLQLPNTALGSVLECLSSSKGFWLVLHSPDIGHAAGFDKYATGGALHEAGYDAYAAGYVFLRMAHYLSAKGISSMASRPLVFREYVQKLQDFENKINIIRAMLNYLDLGGPDPQSRRPQWLHVTSRGLAKPLDIVQLAHEFGAFSSVDVQVIDRRHALLAVATYGGSRDIMRNFKDHKLLSVVKYSPLQHNRSIRMGLWSALIVSGAICAWAFVSSQPKATE